MIEYCKERIVIIGLGITGLSCVKFFYSRGIFPKVIDTRNSPPCLNKLPSGISYHLGSIKKEWILNATLIVISPGISRLEPILILAKRLGISIIGDIELFAMETSSKIIAITGSNGKSTVTKMIGDIIKNSGLRVGVCGNIGIPALELVNLQYDFFVLELSSFQLETTYSLKSISTVLNISKDHMDRYPLGLKQYLSNKLKIYNNAIACIVNADDVLTFPKSYMVKNVPIITFGTNNCDYYINKYHGENWLMAFGIPLINCSKMIIKGNHNYINALVAIAITDFIGIPRNIILKTLEKFQGLPHRFEIVCKKNGVTWINDSKSTNIGSTESALNSLEVKRTLHLLLGGDGKSADFSSLRSKIKNKNIKLYCFGKDGKNFMSLKPKSATFYETLEQAMYIISKSVRYGDTVLLSPACSSLDQFKNFEERGEVFTNIVKKLYS